MLLQDLLVYLDKMTEKLHEKILKKSEEVLREKGAETIKSISLEAFTDIANSNGVPWLNHKSREAGKIIRGNIDIGRTTIPVKDSRGEEVLNVALTYRINQKTGEAVYYSAISLDTLTSNYGEKN